MVKFKRGHKIAGVIVAIVSLLVLIFNIHISITRHNALLDHGFEYNGELYHKTVGPHLINITPKSPHRNNSRMQHRNLGYEYSVNFFFVDIITKSETANLASIFCSQVEYESNQKLGSWYPTSAIMLANGYHVGKCFPNSMVKRILALPKRTFKMDSYLEKKLYMPKLVSPNTYYNRMRFLSSDVTELSNDLTLFLPYYDLQFGHG